MPKWFLVLMVINFVIASIAVPVWIDTGLGHSYYLLSFVAMLATLAFTK